MQTRPAVRPGLRAKRFPLVKDGFDEPESREPHRPALPEATQPRDNAPQRGT
jgi:hypothetical protein